MIDWWVNFILYGLIDSLWVKKEERRGKEKEKYECG